MTRLFSGPKYSHALRNTRNRFRELYGELFGPEKFSGVLRNARLVVYIVKTPASENDNAVPILNASNTEPAGLAEGDSDKTSFNLNAPNSLEFYWK